MVKTDRWRFFLLVGALGWDVRVRAQAPAEPARNHGLSHHGSAAWRGPLITEADEIKGYGRPMASSLLGRGARSLARAPISLYQAGFGFLFGHRVLMLEHIGRKTGLPRYVVLEVVRRLFEDTFVVAAGMGPTADWYRNVERQPQVRVWVGSRKAAVAVARPIEQSEARRHFEAYRAERPWTWRLLRPVISRLIGHPGQTDEDLFATVPLVEVRLDVPG